MATLLDTPGCQTPREFVSMSPTLCTLQELFLKATNSTCHLPEVLSDEEVKYVAYDWLRQTLGVLEYERDRSMQLEIALEAAETRNCQAESELVLLRREVERLTMEVTGVKLERDKFLVEKGLYQQQLCSSQTDLSILASVSPAAFSPNLEHVISQYSDLRVQNSQLQQTVCSLEGELATTKVRLATLMEKEETLQSRIRELGGLALKNGGTRDSNLRIDTHRAPECTPGSTRSKPPTFRSSKMSSRFDIPLDSARSGCNSKRWGWLGSLSAAAHKRSGSVLFPRGSTTTAMSSRGAGRLYPTAEQDGLQCVGIERSSGGSSSGRLLRSMSVGSGNYTPPSGTSDRVSGKATLNTSRLEKQQVAIRLSSCIPPEANGLGKMVATNDQQLNNELHRSTAVDIGLKEAAEMSPVNNCASSTREQKVWDQQALTPPSALRDDSDCRKRDSRQDSLLHRILHSPRKSASHGSSKVFAVAKNATTTPHGKEAQCRATDGVSRSSPQQPAHLGKEPNENEATGELILPGITGLPRVRPAAVRESKIQKATVDNVASINGEPWNSSNQVSCRISTWSFNDT